MSQNWYTALENDPYIYIYIIIYYLSGTDLMVGIYSLQHKMFLKGVHMYQKEEASAVF